MKWFKESSRDFSGFGGKGGRYFIPLKYSSLFDLLEMDLLLCLTMSQQPCFSGFLHATQPLYDSYSWKYRVREHERWQNCATLNILVYLVITSKRTSNSFARHRQNKSKGSAWHISLKFIFPRELSKSSARLALVTITDRTTLLELLRMESLKELRTFSENS